jgi:hypothetical protein
MISAEVTKKIANIELIGKQAKAKKPKATKAKLAVGEPTPAASAPVVEPASDSVTRDFKAAWRRGLRPEPLAAESAATVSVAPVAEPAAPAPAPTIPLTLKQQVFKDFGLRTATHRAVMVDFLIDHLNEQVPFTTLAATAWANIAQKTNTTTSVSTSIKKLERRITRNGLEDRYAIRREVIDGALTAGLYKL